MFKLGSCLMFITFTQLIAVISYTEMFPGVGITNSLDHIHPLIYLIILAELCFSGYLTYIGYSKFKKLE